jgi:hypothetical protein
MSAVIAKSRSTSNKFLSSASETALRDKIKCEEIRKQLKKQTVIKERKWLQYENKYLLNA